MSDASLGNKTARGVGMLMGASLAGKLVSGLGQFALAFLLLPEEFGLVALAFTVMAFSRAIEQLGLREILIREQERFDRWMNSAMWLAGAVGLLGAALTAGFAPLAAYIFDEPAMIGLVLVLAPASPLLSLAQICEAKLERDMRYGQVTIIHFGVVALQMVMMVTLAALGFGAFSFVIPRFAVSLIRLVYVWRLVRPKVRRTPQVHRWRPLLKSGAPIMVAAVLGAALENIDYVILGLITTSTAVGFYYFAFMQSTQLIQVFSISLMRVLVPSLSTLKNDPERMARVYLRGIGLVGLGIAPLCVMQAAAAGPALRLLFGDKWLDSIPLLQLLSLSVVFSVISWPIISLIMAQGRYTLRLLTMCMNLLLFTSSVTIGALIGEAIGGGSLGALLFATGLFTDASVTASAGGGAVGAAIGVLVHRSWYGPLQMWYVMRSNGVRLLEIARVYAAALLNSAIAIGPVWLCSAYALPLLVEEQPWLDVWRLVFIVGVGPVAFALWLRTTQRTLWAELVGRAVGVLPARFGKLVPGWVK